MKLDSPSLLCIFAMTVKDLLHPEDWTASASQIDRSPSKIFGPLRDPMRNPYISNMLECFEKRERGKSLDMNGNFAAKLIDKLLEDVDVDDGNLAVMRRDTRKQRIANVRNLLARVLARHPRTDSDAVLALSVFSNMVKRQFLAKK